MPRAGRKSLLLLLGLPFVCLGADWPQYRGPNHDGISTDRINKQWTGSVTNALWRVYLGNGLTSFAVSGGRALTQVHRDVNGTDMEVCVALDAANGTELWATPVDDIVAYDGGVGTTDDGPRTTPIVDGGPVYVLTSYLKLLRLNATNGTVVWSNDLRITYGGDVISWQNAASPLVEDGLIFLNANAGTSRLMALRTTNGSLAWRSQNEGMTHSTPVLATIHGVRQLIFATQSGLVAVDPQTGSQLWRTNHPFSYSTSLAVSPVVYSNMIFVSGAYSMGSTVTRVNWTNNTWTTTLLWHNSSWQSHWMTPVCHDGFLYGPFGSSLSAPLRCVHMATGIQKWSVNNFGRGGVLLVNDQILGLTELGDLVLVQPNTNAYTELARFQAIRNFNTDTNKCWNAPAVADGKVYVRSTANAAAFDLSMPDLKLDAPEPAPANEFQLTVRTVNGTPVNSNRVPVMEVRASTNLALSPAQWTKLTNALILTNGLVRVTNVDATPPLRFFIVSEPQ